MTKSHAVPLCPVQDVTHPFVPASPHCRLSLPVSRSRGLSDRIDCQGVAVLAFRSPLLYFLKAPKCKSSNAGNSDMPQKSFKVLPLSKKVTVLNLIRKEEHRMLRFLRSTVRVNLPSAELLNL